LTSYTNPLNAYKETKVRTAGQGKLIVMLYDEALKQIDTCLAQLEGQSRQLDSIHNSIAKAQDIITELTVSLDFERGGEIAKNLFNLYMFFNRQLMEGNVRKDPEPIRHIRTFLTQLRDAWVQIAHTQVEGAPANSGVDIAG